MLVSVIVPNYNHSKYLKQRLDSILEQTYQDFELIILDDCSKDDSAEIINNYANNEKVSYIVINEINSGSTYKQWEKGFNLAKGDLIWIAESDDYCEKNFLQSIVPLFISNANLALAYCTSTIVDSNGELCGFCDSAEKIPERLFDGNDFIKQNMIAGNSIWNASAVVFRRSNVLSISNDYIGYVASGDHLFWVELAETGQVMHLASKMNYYRQHNNKVTPTRVKDGTTYREEKRVIDYIKSKHELSAFDRLYIKASYVLRILRGSCWDPTIKTELLSLWGYKKWMKQIVLKVIIHIHNII